MSILSVYHVSSPELPNKVLTHLEDIASTLAEQGVVFERLPAITPVSAGATHEEVVAAYREPVSQLMNERGLVSSAVISVDERHPQKAELRAGFLDEHRHEANEVRFFVAGRGLCSFHVGDYVYTVLCEKNDLISIPAGTCQWFDIGEQPRVVVVRLFDTPDGQHAKMTEATIAGQFPNLDD
ncbi:1,2-dihydroxy-3-keto-5-methylthiopentene dioxygenase [Pseudomonas sp. UBA1879]|uniref:1,2-dihydroxy-3-keto-5-methylthiopentene dioxygenase n=1 Tax=Pseudomonas sp. UBA1879 TaxID=1947305 RepID=UPI0025E4B723|nr:acireductone dioxygenase [Pseudomonas sp. UBA1879]